MSARSDQAAKRFFDIVQPSETWDDTDHKAKPLIRAAFLLYEREWHPYDIKRWGWPFDELQRDARFTGDEPWAVLLRRTMELVKDESA